MGKKKKRRGTPPNDNPGIRPSTAPENSGYPALSFRLLERGWGIDTISAEMAHSFLEKWEKRSTMLWDELRGADRHGLGSESLPTSAIIPALPAWMDPASKLIVFRHHERLPQVGIRIANTFEVIWIESKFNTLYSHDGKNRR